MAKEIFISYSRKDFDKVKAIKDEIDREVGIDCWMDLDGIESGSRDFEEIIVSAIDNHDTFLFMLSRNSMNSKYALRELNYAEQTEKRIILVYIEPCKMINRFLFRYGEADTIEWSNTLQHNKLIADLRKWFPSSTQREKSIQELAEEGDAEAQYQIGCHYFKEDDFPKASKWFLKAANQGIIPAQAFSGWLYEHGEGSYISYEENIRWYKKAGKQGNIKSQKEMEYFYEPGKGGLKTDRIQAVYWYQKAAEQGDVDAQYMLGQCYYYGHGVKQYKVLAVYWYQKAAEQGDANAQYDLGFCYERGIGVKQDYSQAVYWYRKAAEQGHANAQYGFGYFYEKGKGVKQDYPQAVYWYRKAAEQGHAWAQIYLGICYEEGKGVKQDYTQAVYWYKKAVEEGEEEAMFYLGECYEQSVKDYSQAVYWYKKAAAGFGFLPNEAKKWLKAHNIDY